MILNVGNRSELVARYGRDTDAWIGQQITLITLRVQGPSGMTWGIRFEDIPTTTGNRERTEEYVDDELPATGGGTYAKAKPARTRSFN